MRADDIFNDTLCCSKVQFKVLLAAKCWQPPSSLWCQVRLKVPLPSHSSSSSSSMMMMQGSGGGGGGGGGGGQRFGTLFQGLLSSGWNVTASIGATFQRDPPRHFPRQCGALSDMICLRQKVLTGQRALRMAGGGGVSEETRVKSRIPAFHARHSRFSSWTLFKQPAGSRRPRPAAPLVCFPRRQRGDRFGRGRQRSLFSPPGKAGRELKTSFTQFLETVKQAGGPTVRERGSE